MAEFEVGKFYKVRCVYGRIWDFHDWWPMLTELHEDREIIQFPYDHIHLDARFLNRRLADIFDFRFGYGFNHTIFAVPFQVGNGLNMEALKIEEKRRMCQRRMPDYPVFSKWHPALEKAYIGLKVVDGKCPHRGVDLTTCPRDGDLVTCPGHGLRWNMVTGELVSRAPKGCPA